MAREDTQFKPGQSGNPAGKPKDQLSKTTIERLVHRLLKLTGNDLQDLVDNPKTASLEALVAKIIQKAIETGDPSRLNFLLDRSIGKVKDIAEVHQHNYDDILDKQPKENVIELLREKFGPKVG